MSSSSSESSPAAVRYATCELRKPTMRLPKSDEEGHCSNRVEKMTALQKLFSRYDDIGEEIMIEWDACSISSSSLPVSSHPVQDISELAFRKVLSSASSSSSITMSDDSDSLYERRPPTPYPLDSDEPGPSGKILIPFPVRTAEAYSHFIYFAVLKLTSHSIEPQVHRQLLSYLWGQVRLSMGDKENQMVDVDERIVSDTRSFFEESWKDTQQTKEQMNIGDFQETLCELCLEVRLLNLRQCCQFAVCVECLAQHASTVIMEGYQTVSCPNYDCSSNFTYDEIIYRLTYSQFSNARTVYLVRCANIKKKSHEYLCPNCGHILSRSISAPANGSGKKNVKHSGAASESGAKVKTNKYEKKCDKCLFMTCSHCKSPAHGAISCKKYLQGDKLMKQWSQNVGTDNRRRAVKCPKCKSWVQKTTGCDHMNCIVCRTEFCYLCGDRYIRIKLIGSHSEKLSILGCRNNFCESRPVLRRSIRGGIFMAGVVATPVVVAVGIPVVLVGGSAVLVTVGGIKLFRFLRRQQAKANR